MSRRNTYGFTKEKAQRISENTEKAYNEQYGLNMNSFAVLYEFTKDSKYIIAKLKEKLDDKTFSFSFLENDFCFYIKYYEDISANKEIEYSKLEKELHRWYTNCTAILIEKEKNNAEV